MATGGEERMKDENDAAENYESKKEKRRDKDIFFCYFGVNFF